MSELSIFVEEDNEIDIVFAALDDAIINIGKELIRLKFLKSPNNEELT